MKNKDIKTINLGEVYNLDLGGSAPISVKPIEVLDNSKILCEYLNSYEGRVEALDIELFKMNGFG
jgi:hypothetical protein